MPKGIPGAESKMSREGYLNASLRRRGRDPHMLVHKAREHSAAALRKLVELMNGNAGKIKVMNKEGVLIEVDIEVPAAVQAKCAEMIIERGYGKSPQAILLSTDDQKTMGVEALPIAERILAIKAARELRGNTTDLEASEQTEIEIQEAEILPPLLSAPAPSARDLI